MTLPTVRLKSSKSFRKKSTKNSWILSFLQNIWPIRWKRMKVRMVSRHPKRAKIKKQKHLGNPKIWKFPYISFKAALFSFFGVCCWGHGYEMDGLVGATLCHLSYGLASSRCSQCQGCAHQESPSYGDAQTQFHFGSRKTCSMF